MGVAQQCEFSATEWYTLKWLIICDVNFIWKKKPKQTKLGITEATTVKSNIYTQNWIRNNNTGKLMSHIDEKMNSHKSIKWGKNMARWL